MRNCVPHGRVGEPLSLYCSGVVWSNAAELPASGAKAEAEAEAGPSHARARACIQFFELAAVLNLLVLVPAPAVVSIIGYFNSLSI